jgi:hypothetical protein
LCASQPSADAGSVQYRFGPEGAPDISFPLAAQEWRTRAGVGMLTCADGGGAYVAFTNVPYRYVVNTAIGRGWGEKSGVAVEKNGKLVSNLPCTQEPVSEFGPELFSKDSPATLTASICRSTLPNGTLPQWRKGHHEGSTRSTMHPSIPGRQGTGKTWDRTLDELRATMREQMLAATRRTGLRECRDYTNRPRT